MTTFEFTTPDLADRDPHTLTVNLCGETWEIDRPKDFVMRGLATTVLAEEAVPTSERAAAILRFLLGTLTEEQYERFMDRCVDRDDPLNLAALIEFLGAISTRWSEFAQHHERTGNRLPDHKNPPIDITTEPGTGIHGDTVRLVNDDLGLDTTAHPPKDILIMVMAAFSAYANAHHWIAERFLAAVLPETEFAYLRRRLMSRHDKLDVEHLDPMISRLINHWSESLDEVPAPPEPNRAERRAAAHASRHGTL